jgi:MoaA/NifB/PqqE/SkfB family radical SAM enzyme
VVTSTTVLTEVNIASITSLANLINELSEEITIANWKIFKFKPKGRGKLYRHLFDISDEEFLKAIETAKRVARVKVYPIRDPDRMRVKIVKKD